MKNELIFHQNQIKIYVIIGMIQDTQHRRIFISSNLSNYQLLRELSKRGIFDDNLIINLEFF